MMKYYDPDKREDIVRKSIKDGFCKDWYYRAQVLDVELMTENNYVILKVYNGELESELFYAVKLSDFDEVFKKQEEEDLIVGNKK